MSNESVYAVTLRLPIADTGPCWDTIQAMVDNQTRIATDAGDQDAVRGWNAVHDAISEQLP